MENIIKWNDGTEDELLLTVDGDIITISSDANFSGRQRSRILTIKTPHSTSTSQFTVSQEIGDEVVLMAYGNNDTVISRSDFLIGFDNN